MERDDLVQAALGAGRPAGAGAAAGRTAPAARRAAPARASAPRRDGGRAARCSPWSAAATRGSLAVERTPRQNAASASAFTARPARGAPRGLEVISARRTPRPKVVARWNAPSCSSVSSVGSARHSATDERPRSSLQRTNAAASSGSGAPRSSSTPRRRKRTAIASGRASPSGRPSAASASSVCGPSRRAGGGSNGPTSGRSPPNRTGCPAATVPGTLTGWRTTDTLANVTARSLRRSSTALSPRRAALASVRRKSLRT